MGDLTPCSNYKDIVEVVQRAMPEANSHSIGSWAGGLWALRIAMSVGDFAIMPRRGLGLVAIGAITSDYVYDRSRPVGQRHYRKVDWKQQEIPKTALGADIQRTLNYQGTICEFSAADVFQRVALIASGKSDPGVGNGDLKPSIGESDLDVSADAQLSIQELIRDRFPTHDLAMLVESILKANGFETVLSPPGPDGGVDILAARGDIGFDGPRIAVQVKNSLSAMGVGEVNALLGAGEQFGAERCLFVSWGGFTNQTRSHVKTKWFKIRLWDAEDLVREVTNVYDQLDPSIRLRLPLKQVWTAVLDESDQS